MAELITSVKSTADEYYHKQSVAPTDAAELDADADAYFPLQPIEKKLCAYSLGLGLGLMACFVILFEVL